MELSGQGGWHPETLGYEQLPALEQRVSFLTGHGTEQATYTGALLWSVLEKAGALSGEPRGRLRRVVAVIGRDGYVVAVALAEIDPEFEGSRSYWYIGRMVSHLPGNERRLVVPGDRRGRRSVRDVMRIGSR